MPCITVPTAMLISAGVGVAGSLGSAFIGASAAEKAADEQKAAAESASLLLDPYADAGAAALAQLNNLLGLGTEGTDGILSSLQKTPGYQFALTQGLQATQNGYAAKGLAVSGAAQKGAADYAEGLAGTTYQDMVTDYYNLTQTGEAATAGQANLLTGAGTAEAAGTVGAANATTSGITNAVNAVGNAAYGLGAWNSTNGMYAQNELLPEYS